MVPFTGVVLTGGASTRMGRDKALLEVGGVAMARRAADVLEAAGAEVVVCVGGDRQALEGLGLAVVEDCYPGAGPLGALLTAFASAQTDVIMVLACDMPDVDSATIGVLRAAVTGRGAAVPLTDGLHPLCAAYRVSSCRGPFQRAFDGGERAVHRALAFLDTVAVELADSAVLRNVNRPRDLAGQ